MVAWNADKADKREQFKLIYDYIKFHIGLYLATPTVFAVMARSFSVETSGCLQGGLSAMILIYLVAGIHAGWFIGTYVNVPWTQRFPDDFAEAIFSTSRRAFHHWLYWGGLIVGFCGLASAVLFAKYQFGFLAICKIAT